MRIYTRTGDKGETSLRWGQRVPKDAARVEAYGAVDELNSFIGLALALLPAEGGPAGTPAGEILPRLRAGLPRVQHELFDVGADLATPPDRTKGEEPRVRPEQVEALERDIDALDGHLPELRQFILPGGSPAAAALQVARAVCRRAERRLVSLARQEPVEPVLIQYLNRLSDYLFVAARATNLAAGVAEPRVSWSWGRRGQSPRT